MIRPLNQFARAFLDFFYPPYCLVCSSKFDQATIPVCAACWQRLSVIRRHYCTRCGSAVPAATYGCPDCSEREFAFARARVLMKFDPVMQNLIHHVKYRHKKSIAFYLGERLGKQVRNDPDFERAGALVPIPLHRSRRRWRGFNQSEYVARGIGRVLEVPVETGLVTRVRKTRSQTGFNAAERRENVRGVFAVPPGQTVPEHAVLVDDVLTTGSTASECAATLQAAGTRKVTVLAVARA